MNNSVILVEIMPRRPSDGEVLPLRLIGGSTIRADHMGQQWLPFLARAPRITSRLGFDGHSFGEGAVSTVGDITVSLGADKLKPFENCVYADAIARIYSGPAQGKDEDFTLLWQGRAADATISEGSLIVRLADPAEDLQRPVLAESFKGTGGEEGPAELKGRPKPRGFGICENVPAILLDQAAEIYFITTGAATVTAVKDGGLPYAEGPVASSFSQLRSMTVPAGSAATLSIADMTLVRPWTRPRFTLTADIVAGPTTPGAIMEAIVTDRTDLTFLPQTVTDFDAQAPDCGSFIVEERPIAEELDRFCAGLGGWWKLLSAGQIALGRFDFGKAQQQAFSHQISKISRNAILMPTRARKLGYRRNFRPLSDSEIAGALKGINWRGTFKATDSYAIDDAVHFEGQAFIATAVTNAGESPSASPQKWSLLAAAGVEGPQGPAGPQGVPGPKGNDGQTLYTWVAYADSANGATNFTTGAPGSRKYIGLANNKTSPTESQTPSDYVWSKFAGDDGVPGSPGADGQPTYTWFAYADSADGATNFTTGAPGGRKYIGIAPNETSQSESSNPADYTWSLFVGADGQSGALNMGWKTDNLDHWYANEILSAPIGPQYSVETITDGVMGNKVIRGTDNNNDGNDVFSEHIPIDPTKNYRVSATVRQLSGDRLNYLGVSFRRADGTRINGYSGGASGWTSLGSFHYWAFVNQVFPSTLTTVEFIFGPQGQGTIPSGAAFAQLLWLGLRGGSTESTIEINGYRLVELPSADDIPESDSRKWAGESGANRTAEQSVNLYPIESDGVEAFASVGSGSQGMDWTSAGNGPGDDPLRTILATDIGAVPGATRVSQSAEIWTDNGQEVWLRVSFVTGPGFGTVIEVYDSQKVTSQTPTSVKVEDMTWPLGATRMWAQIVKRGASAPPTTLHMRRFMANLGPVAAPYTSPTRGATKGAPPGTNVGNTPAEDIESSGAPNLAPPLDAFLRGAATGSKTGSSGFRQVNSAVFALEDVGLEVGDKIGLAIEAYDTSGQYDIHARPRFWDNAAKTNFLGHGNDRTLDLRSAGATSFAICRMHVTIPPGATHIDIGAGWGDSSKPGISGTLFARRPMLYKGHTRPLWSPATSMKSEDGATNGASWLDNLRDRPLELIDGRIASALSPIGRLWDSRRATQSLVGGMQSVMTASPVSATQSNGVATIFVAPHSRYYDFGAVSYNGGSIGGLSTSTTYYIYADDQNYSGGVVPWHASTSITNAIAPGRIYLGRITTPAATSGSGGGATVPRPDDCVAANMFLSDGRTAGDIQAGNLTYVMDDDMRPLGLRPVISNVPAQTHCIRLVTKSAQVVVSASAPVVTTERGTLRAIEICGLTVGVLIDGVFGFETVETILPEGNQTVARIRVGGISYAAGTRPGRLIFTHNPFFKP